MRKNYRYLLLILSTSAATNCSIERPLGSTPEHRKNLAYTLTPVTTFGFGQNIVDKKNLLFYPYIYFFTGKNTHLVELAPAFLYGITNWLSLYVIIPFFTPYKINGVTSSGLSNIIIQMEYAFIQQISDTAINEATIVINVSPPSAHLKTSFDLCCTPTTLANSASFFLGATASHTSLDWYIYGSAGVTISVTKECTHYGNSWLYEAGIGHYLASVHKQYTLAGILEFNGVYNQKNSAFGQHIQNSGGNTFYIGPSLCLCANRWQVQGGFQLPAVQKLNGCQQKQSLRGTAAFTWIF